MPTLRSKALRIASELPEGDATRRKLLALLSENGTTVVSMGARGRLKESGLKTAMSQSYLEKFRRSLLKMDLDPDSQRAFHGDVRSLWGGTPLPPGEHISLGKWLWRPGPDTLSRLADEAEEAGDTRKARALHSTAKKLPAISAKMGKYYGAYLSNYNVTHAKRFQKLGLTMVDQLLALGIFL